jgi:hypothetical protein
MNEAEKSNRLEAERDAQGALVKLRLLLAQFGNRPLTQENILPLVRSARDQMNVLSTALPLLPSDRAEMIERQETARESYKSFLENA